MYVPSFLAGTFSEAHGISWILTALTCGWISLFALHLSLLCLSLLTEHVDQVMGKKHALALDLERKSKKRTKGYKTHSLYILDVALYMGIVVPIPITAG